MTDTIVLHYHTKHYVGTVLEKGAGVQRRVLNLILGGHVDGSIDKIERYDTDEHTADDVTEDMARELAAAVVDIGDPASTQVRDFIEENLGVGTALRAVG